MPGNLLAAPTGTEVTATEMNEFLTGLDNTMNGMADQITSGIFIQDLFKEQPAEKDIILVRQCLRSLLLVGNFGDLSVQAQVHPGMQERLKYSLNEMNEALSGVTERLKSLTPEDKQHIKTVLNEDPELPEKILETIDLEAQYVKVPNRRRRQLRAMQRRIVKRLKHSPDMLVDEYVKKIDKVERYTYSEEEMEKLLIKQMGKENYEATVKEAEMGLKKWNKMNLDETPIGYENILLDQQSQEKEKDPGLKKAQKVLGIGAITTGAGWVLIAIGASSEALIFLAYIGVAAGITIGPIILLIGLIMLLVHAGQKSKAKKAKLKE
jgi:hypothetical protein